MALRAIIGFGKTTSRASPGRCFPSLLRGSGRGPLNPRSASSLTAAMSQPKNVPRGQQKMDDGFLQRQSEDESTKPPLTRPKVPQTEKVKCLTIPLNERRQHYSCGSNFVRLDKIATWENYYRKKEGRLEKKVAQKKVNIEPNPVLSRKVSIWLGDITSLEIDCIINAANQSLMGGGGVDGAIHSAAGPSLKQECASLNGCNTGDAKITCGYKLPAKHVIHTVGPMETNPAMLRSCYEKSLKLVEEHQLRSVAFPCISTGIYGYPNEEAAKVALKTIRKWLEQNADKVDRIIFCLFLEKDVAVYEELMQSFFPVEKMQPPPGNSFSLKSEDGDSLKVKNAEENLNAPSSSEAAPEEADAQTKAEKATSKETEEKATGKTPALPETEMATEHPKKDAAATVHDMEIDSETQEKEKKAV